MRKTIVYFAHPAHRHSVANAALARVAREVTDVTFVDLYAEYPRMKIDVDREQERLMAHDAIVFQFPLMWYSTPSILKEWQDLVLEYGFAYGDGGDRLKGKLFLPVVSVGGPEDAYRPEGYNRFELRTLLSPLEQTANLCSMRYVSPFVLFAALKARNDARLETHSDGYRELLEALRDETLDLTAADELGQMTAAQLPIKAEASQ